MQAHRTHSHIKPADPVWKLGSQHEMLCVAAKQIDGVPEHTDTRKGVPEHASIQAHRHAVHAVKWNQLTLRSRPEVGMKCSAKPAGN